MYYKEHGGPLKTHFKTRERVLTPEDVPTAGPAHVTADHTRIRIPMLNIV